VQLVAQAVLKNLLAGPDDLRTALYTPHWSRLGPIPIPKAFHWFDWDNAVDDMVTLTVVQYMLYKDAVPVVNKTSRSKWYLLLPWHHAVQANAAGTLNDPNLCARQIFLLQKTRIACGVTIPGRRVARSRRNGSRQTKAWEVTRRRCGPNTRTAHRPR
jgi:hypothetical protein